MSIGKKNPFRSLLINFLNYESFHRETPLIIRRSSVFSSNGAIVVFTSSTAAVLPLLPRGQPLDGGAPAILFGYLRNTYSAFVVCLMFSFACAFTSMILLMKKPKASRLLNISSALWLSSAFALLFSAIIRNYA